MLMGRFLFGIGSECAYVVQNNACIEWFSNTKHLALAMGISTTVARLGSILAFDTESAIAKEMGYKFGLFVAFFTCCLSLSSALVYSFMDKWAKKQEIPEVRKDPLCINPRKFSVHFWLWVIIAVTIYSSIFPFLAISNSYIVEKWEVSPEQAGYYLGFIDLTSLILSPVFGWIVDFTGKRGYLVILGNATAVFAYGMLAFTPVFPIIPIALLGIHFSMMPAALWPCLPLLVDKHHTSIGYAIVSSLMNASLTGIHPLAGVIASEYRMFGLCIFLAGISGISVIVAIIWNYLDSKRLIPLLNRKYVDKGQ